MLTKVPRCNYMDTAPIRRGGVLTYTWDLDNNGTFETSGQNPVFSAAGKDGPNSRTVVLRVTDNQGASTTALGTVNIQNVAPTVPQVVTLRFMKALRTT